MTQPGHFLPFLLTFQGKSADEQATAILDEARTLIAAGAPGVGITYSANYGQTQAIRAVYAAGGWDTHTNGSNQAGVMHAMETLEGGAYADLQTLMRIVPITTMTYTGFGGLTMDEVITADMQAIQDLLDGGWTILGWRNDPRSDHYAVGGGVAKQWYEQHPKEALSPAQSQRIQTALAGFATQYPPAS